MCRPILPQPYEIMTTTGASGEGTRSEKTQYIDHWMCSLKTEGYSGANFVVTGGTPGCRHAAVPLLTIELASWELSVFSVSGMYSDAYHWFRWIYNVCCQIGPKPSPDPKKLVALMIMQWIFITKQSGYHYSDVIMSEVASQITGVSIICSTVWSGTDQRKRQSSASLAGGFPSQSVNNAGNASIWWCHHALVYHGRHLISSSIRSSDNDSTGFWSPGSLHTLGADGHI